MAVRQVPGSSAGVIYLVARIQPSIALYHWQLFHVASLRNPSMYPAVWQAATEQYVRAHRYHEQQLPPPQHIAAVKATTRMLLPLHCPPSSDRAAPALPTDLAPVKPLFQLTQILLSHVPSDVPHASKTASSSEPDSPRSLQIKSAVVNPVAPTAANEVAMLQTVLLVLKLISLLTAVTSPSVSATTAVVVLWQTVINTLSTLPGIQCNRGWPEDSIDSMRSEHPSHSEAWFDTVVALTGLLMTQLRQVLVKDGMSEQASLCCNSLSSLLELPSLKRSYRTAVAMAAAIKNPGSFHFFAPPQIHSAAMPLLVVFGCVLRDCTDGRAASDHCYRMSVGLQAAGSHHHYYASHGACTHSDYSSAHSSAANEVANRVCTLVLLAHNTVCSL